MTEWSWICHRAVARRAEHDRFEYEQGGLMGPVLTKRERLRRRAAVLPLHDRSRLLPCWHQRCNGGFEFGLDACTLATRQTASSAAPQQTRPAILATCSGTARLQRDQVSMSRRSPHGGTASAVCPLLSGVITDVTESEAANSSPLRSGPDDLLTPRRPECFNAADGSIRGKRRSLCPVVC
jgi:hypothetical protein